MQIIEPTEKAFVLSTREKDTLEAAANILEYLSDNMNDGCPLTLYCEGYGTNTYTRTEILDVTVYLRDFAVAETITEKS